MRCATCTRLDVEILAIQSAGPPDDMGQSGEAAYVEALSAALEARIAHKSAHLKRALGALSKSPKKSPF